MPADYGIDAPGDMRGLWQRGVIFLVTGVGGWAALRASHPGIGTALLNTGLWAGLSQIVAAVVMLWSSRKGKLSLRDRLLDSIPWKGNERVLDVGCGRGLALIGCAKRVPSGQAVGIDLWSNVDLSANSPDATLANAKAEGVADRITIDTGDARQLPYPDHSFDVVVSMTALHNIPSQEDRERALAEILRVLRPGGRLAIFDIFHAGSYAKALRKLGALDVTTSGLILLWCVPGRTITARSGA